jgi:anti-anti-sigma factor
VPDLEQTAPNPDASLPPADGGDPGTVQVIVEEGRTRIVLSGEIDADVADELAEASAEAAQLGLPIEVDTHHVTFMDSSGVAFLARLTRGSTGRVRLLRVPPTVRFLLEVTRIGDLLDVDDEPPAGSSDAPPQP